MCVKVNKNVGILAFKQEIKLLESRLKTLLPQGEEDKINTDTVQGFQLILRVKCLKSNITVLKDQLKKMEEA